MQPRLVYLSAISLIITLACACGSGGTMPGLNSGGPNAGLSAAGPNAGEAGTAGTAGLAQQAAAYCLPALSALPAPEHAVSIAGPGWYEVNPKSTLVRRGGLPSLPGQIVLAAAGQTAFAIYGVSGFDGDSFPTGVRLTLADVTGDYYVGFSDYLAGNWRFNGRLTDSATVEIPALDDYSSPAAYVNPNGWHYFVIVIPDGGGLTVTGVELGAHGGSLGPRPPISLAADSSEASLVLTWNESPDARDPDFAGYVVERAPLLSGDFAPLGPPDPLAQLYYVDTTGELDVQYRYHVAAVDASGNRGGWTGVKGGRKTGETAEPVAVLDAPHGPYYGPAQVTFDLSQSFDPEHPGVPSPSIDSYALYFTFGPDAVISPNPLITVTLQPGCYQYTAAVSVTAEARSGGTTRTLVVYPRWQAAPVEVCGSEPSVAYYARTSHQRIGRHPADGRIALFSYDVTIPGFAVWQQTGAGGFELSTLPTYSYLSIPFPVSDTGETAVYRDSLITPVALDNNFYLAVADEAGAHWLPATARNSSAPVAAATDGASEIWLVHASDNAGTEQLQVTTIEGAQTTVIIPNIEPLLTAVDAVYNPASGMIDVAYCWDDGVGEHLEYVRWDPVNQLIDGETVPNIELVHARNLDIEINPANDRAALVYYSLDDSRNHYRELNADGLTWSAAEFIDNSNANGVPSLEFAGASGNPTVMFGLGPWPNRQVQLYEKDAGVWSVRNTASYSADSGNNTGLVRIPGSDDFIAADVSQHCDLYVAAFHADGTDEVRPWAQFGADYLPCTVGQGFELHGAAGADGLHAIWRNAVGHKGYHYLSPDGGATWNNAGDLVGWLESLDLTANRDGDVYCSYVNTGVGDATLSYWDGAAFAARRAIPANGRHRPFFSALPGAGIIHWTAYEEATGDVHYISGNELLGYADDFKALSDGPLWTGVTANVLEVLGLPANVEHFALAGGLTPDAGVVGLYADGDDAQVPYFDSLLPEPLDLLSVPESYGCGMAASGYIGKVPVFPSQVVWVVQRTFPTPVRIERDFLTGTSITELPSAGDIFNLNPDVMDIRRTVSAELAWGLTAVGLMSNFGGTDVLFEWSNFGEWENLALPAGIGRMTMPELIVGMDGRWHILYHDNELDRMLCISTL